MRRRSLALSAPSVWLALLVMTLLLVSCPGGGNSGY